MIIVAVILIIIGFIKIVTSKEIVDLQIPPEYSSLLNKKDKIVMIAGGVVLFESLLEILSGAYIIYAY
jgi:hypothetical protein